MFALALVLALSPAALDEDLKVAEALVQRGSAARAVPILLKILKNDTATVDDKARANTALGTAYLQQKKAKDAVVVLDLSSKLRPSDEKTWLLLGMAHDGAGAFDKSVAVYRDGAKANPKSWQLRHELAMTLLEAGQVKDAVSLLDEAVELAPRRAELLTDHAFANVLVGRFDRARESAQLSISLAPRNPDAFYNLGSAEAGLKEKKRAKEAFAQALNLEPLHVPALYRLGLLEVDDKEDAKAARHFLKILKIDSEHKRAQAQLGLALGRLKKDDKAKEILKKVVHADPSYLPGRVMLAEIYERGGDNKNALAEWLEIQKQRPKDEKVKAQVDALAAKVKGARKGK